MNEQISPIEEELAQIEQVIAGQEAALNLLPDDQREAAAAILATLHQRRQQLLAQVQGSGAIAQGDKATAVGERGVLSDFIFVKDRVLSGYDLVDTTLIIEFRNRQFVNDHSDE